MKINTMNSTYEVDFANSQVRRLTGNAVSVLDVQDGEWKTFVEAKRHEAGDSHVWFFVLGQDDGIQWMRTSLVVSEEE